MARQHDIIASFSFGAFADKMCFEKLSSFKIFFVIYYKKNEFYALVCILKHNLSSCVGQDRS